ncbi:MAG: ABC transporter permease [Planctomycetota bacterium]|nr:ABC transporter permease [Planctomycetota bacterium]
MDCFLVLPQGFEKSLDRFWEGGGELRMGIDPTKQAQSGILRGLIMRTWFELMHQRFMDVERSRELVSDGIEQLEQSEELGWMEKGVLLTFLRSLDDMLGNVSDEEGFAQGAQGGGFNGPEIVTQDVSRDSVGPRSAFEVTFPSGILWAMIACVSAFAVSTVRERTHGTLLRLNVAPVTHSHFLAGKALAAFIACTVVTLMLLAISQLPAFGVRFDEPGKVALAVICNSLCFVGITMLVSTLGKTEQAVGGLSWGVLLIMAMFGGGMIPLFIMPDWLLVLSDFSPVKWGITAFEGAIWRDYSYAELALPCGILLAVGVVGFLVGVFRLSKQGRA